MGQPLPADDLDPALLDAQEAMQDALLLERVLHGDAEAYGRLVSRHMRRAFAVAYRILQHREDAEDVVQDSFIRALERIDQLQRGRPFRPWLLRIVVNRALNFRRGRTLRLTEPIPDSAAAPGGAPDRSAERADLRAHLSRALAALPEKQRTIVQLADLENLTSAEIGEIMELSDGTVRWHLHEARKALRLSLAPVREDT
ncbi:MAG TPA: RNA polymerase sigma factor [Longimicrobiales bacterium]